MGMGSATNAVMLPMILRELENQITMLPRIQKRVRFSYHSRSTGVKCVLTLDSVTSPVSPSSHSQSTPDSEEPEAPEAEEDDEDDIIILSQRPLGSAPKHDRRTGNGTRSLRRRPFLIFDKTEAKGYKQLKNKPQPANTLTALRYQPGDGFSGREAKPNGSNLLTRAGKLSVTGHHVGILDLTQSDPALAKKKRNIRRANLDDNSFVSAPKKKARRPLQPKDPNQQLKPAMTAPTLMKKSSSVINAAEKDQIQLPARGPETGHAVEKPVQVAAVRDNSLRPNTTRQMPPDDDEVDMLIIQRSDDVHENPSTTAHGHGMAAEEGQDSCGTHVTDSPQRKLRIRARSVSPDSPSCRTADVGEEPEKWERVFRRFNTQ
jgi:hypothetical protein